MREINTILAAKCRVTEDKAGPRLHDEVKNMVGGTSMFGNQLREMNTKILKRIGVVKLQTIHEKYDKAFDKLTLTKDELMAKKKDMRKRIHRERMSFHESSDTRMFSQSQGSKVTTALSRSYTEKMSSQP